ncbi:mRNA-decapping enzyme subunit 2 [Podospora pseudoanserina]|uniref:mRNA-decapping enzyme subunit 2 n=1 Tax=Podospora pseudoanserina TaxID=2609844 RepID=A0ABR0HLC0_9PEZI|nr:mRNA-decapping enzyme subunit 2 [Podospora pseudoanserina]
MAENKMQLEDWLDDLCVRFIINLPKEDLSSVARICFQVEEAQWFYEDFIRPLDPTLPSMSLRSFCLRIFQHCPLLASFSAENHMRAFEEFLQYKTRVPVRGAILLNEAMDSTVLVKGWKKGANWSFPRGKINKDEDDLDCAIREVYEETGFDIREAGLVPRDDEVKYIQMSMRDQQIRLYVFRNVPMDTNFHPKTRKEISKIQWYKLSELPAFRNRKGNQQDDAAAASNANKFYMVAPFLVQLKKWVQQQKQKDAARGSHVPVHIPIEEPLTEDDLGTQTEPVAGPTESIETIEGATAELQRLLQVQPPPSGTHVNPHPAPAATANKGNALLALLQKNTETEAAHLPQGYHEQPQHYQQLPQQHHQQPPQPQHQYYQQQQYGNQVPHTPLELTYTTAPEPHTPHHHHPTNRLPVPPNQPPPNFPIQPHGNQNVSQEYFTQQRVPHQMPTQAYGDNSYMAGPRPVQKEPVLLHPQPLPPQVQQSLLTRSILQTPNIPETAHHNGLQAPQGSHHSIPVQGQDGAGYQNQGAPRKAAPQLTHHHMSLLNAFKSNTSRTQETTPVATPQSDVAPAGQQHAGYHPSGQGWPSAPSHTQAPNSAAQYLPHHAVNVPQGYGERYGPQPQHAVAPQVSQHAAANPVVAPRPPQSTESHRSALLDMFKKPGRGSPLSNEITRSSIKSDGERPGYGSNNSQPYGGPSNAEAIARAAEANGAPVQMNPELNLPYRAVQILTRPKQPESAQSNDSMDSQIHRLQRRLSPQRKDARNSGSGLPSPRDRSLFHQLDQETKKSPQLPPAQAGSLPYGQPQPQRQSPYASPTFPPQQPVGPPQQLLQHQQYQHHQRQPSGNADQKQKLLSLFGKAQPSPTGLSANGKMKESMVYDQVRSTTPRSRVASLASQGNAGGMAPSVTGVENVHATGNSSRVPSATNSRRGSQTPISPADRNFLLLYLESVSNQARSQT